jgi:hypothetical protein
MNTTKHKSILHVLLQVLCIAIFTQSVIAEEEDLEKKDCKLPRLRSIKPEPRSEVPPESEFSFTLPNWTDPKKITVTIKKLPTDITIEPNKSFIVVKGKLPASLENTFARISVRAVAELGCTKKDGWLLKISERTAPVQEQAEPQ